MPECARLSGSGRVEAEQAAAVPEPLDLSVVAADEVHAEVGGRAVRVQREDVVLAVEREPEQRLAAHTRHELATVGRDVQTELLRLAVETDLL